MGLTSNSSPFNARVSAKAAATASKAPAGESARPCAATSAMISPWGAPSARRMPHLAKSAAKVLREAAHLVSRTLFAPQRDHGIDSGRPARGQIASQQRDHDDQKRRGNECKWVSRSNPVEHRLHVAGHSQSRNHPDG